MHTVVCVKPVPDTKIMKINPKTKTPKLNEEFIAIRNQKGGGLSYA